MAYPVPTDWTVSGTLNKNGVPFSEGKVYADNLNNGQFEQIAESGISADGSFTLTYSRGNFQNGDESLEFPTIRISHLRPKKFALKKRRRQNRILPKNRRRCTLYLLPRKSTRS